MPKHSTPRKAQMFRAALALAGKTMTEWASDQGVTQAHVSMVLDGKRVSHRVIAEVDRFIGKHLTMSNAA